MRGRTLQRSFVILDERRTIELPMQMNDVLTLLGFNFQGGHYRRTDRSIDLPTLAASGLLEAMEC